MSLGSTQLQAHHLKLQQTNRDKSAQYTLLASTSSEEDYSSLVETLAMFFILFSSWCVQRNPYRSLHYPP